MEQVSGENSSHEREQFAFVQDSTGLEYRYKNEIILVPDTTNQNEFMFAKKYLSMKDVFSVEYRILDNVGMSLPSESV